jgi:hypothetical protein
LTKRIILSLILLSLTLTGFSQDSISRTFHIKKRFPLCGMYKSQKFNFREYATLHDSIPFDSGKGFDFIYFMQGSSNLYYSVLSVRWNTCKKVYTQFITPCMLTGFPPRDGSTWGPGNGGDPFDGIGDYSIINDSIYIYMNDSVKYPKTHFLLFHGVIKNSQLVLKEVQSMGDPALLEKQLIFKKCLDCTN